jgi:hypothetical protein
MEHETLAKTKEPSSQKPLTFNSVPIESKASITVVERRRTIVVLSIQESELRDLGNAQLMLATNLAFFSLMVGLFSAFGTSLLTTHQVLSDRILMILCGLTLVSAVWGAYFGVITWRARGKVKENIERLINSSREADD